MINPHFNMYSDAHGRDPDAFSPTLRYYHRLLWSKPLPNGEALELKEGKRGVYLFYRSPEGDISVGSDAITHSYKNQVRKQWLIEQAPKQATDLFTIGSTIAGYIIFPNKQVNRKNTINQARGVHQLIDDRFDLTLECIKRFYEGRNSPLSEVLIRYAHFFEMFESFEGYVQFFLLQDLIDSDGNVDFYLPFDEFKSPPSFRDVKDYLIYKEKVTSFLSGRTQRIVRYAEGLE